MMAMNPNPARGYGGHGTFPQRLAGGDVGEAALARWFEERGRRVTILARGATTGAGGPRLHGLEGSAVAPDLMIADPRRGRARLLEAKTKSAASWHVRTRCWTSGISLKELLAYQAAEQQTGLQTWLAFVQLGAGDKVVSDAPPPPAGMFVAPVAGLETKVNHTYGRGDWQMLYWRLDVVPWCHLAPLADLDFGS